MATLIWRGPSQLDGREIILALSGHQTASVNSKTGPVLQTWILNAKASPANSVRSGADASVCGHCPHRHHTGGGCYVLLWQSPTVIWRSVRNQESVFEAPCDLVPPIRHNCTVLRLGSYGDPMAVPVHVWKTLIDLVGGLPTVGYTHQWRLNDPAGIHCMETSDYYWYRAHLQASTETAEQDAVAHSLGWCIFRILAAGQTPLPGSYECPASAGLTNCASCMWCGSGRDIWIRPHGARKNRIQ